MEDPSNFEYFDQLCSPSSPQQLMHPYLSSTSGHHSPSGTDEDIYNSLSPDTANHPHRWQQQPVQLQRSVSPQPITITSPFITPVGKTDRTQNYCN